MAYVGSHWLLHGILRAGESVNLEVVRFAVPRDDWPICFMFVAWSWEASGSGRTGGRFMRPIPAVGKGIELGVPVVPKTMVGALGS